VKRGLTVINRNRKGTEEEEDSEGEIEICKGYK